MNLVDVYEQLGTQLDTIPGLRVYPYPTDAVQEPAAVLGLPGTVSFDLTYQRGGDRLTVPCSVLVGRVVDRDTLTQLGPFLSGSGSSSVKRVLEAGVYTAFDFVWVETAVGGTFEVGNVSYYGAAFSLNVVGPGE